MAQAGRAEEVKPVHKMEGWSKFRQTVREAASLLCGVAAPGEGDDRGGQGENTDQGGEQGGTRGARGACAWRQRGARGVRE